MKYQILAANNPFLGYYEKVLFADSLLSAIWKFIKLNRQGYEIIDFHYYYRKPIKFDTSNWNEITMDRSAEDEI